MTAGSTTKREPRVRTLLLALCLVPLSAHVYASPGAALTPKDFAFGRTVVMPDAAAALVQVDLPVDVYRASRSPELQDVRVFNARGGEVPYALRLKEAATVAPAQRTLPLFPLPADTSEAALALAIDVERSAEGGVLRLTSRVPENDGHADPSGAAPGAYLIDARKLERPVLALRFQLAQAPDSLLLPLAIAASRDLIHWREVTVRGALLNLQYAGEHVERDRVEIPPTRAEFFRVRAANGKPLPVRFTTAWAEPSPEQASAERDRVVVQGKQLPDEPGVYRFDLGGAVPVERISLQLPEDNTLIDAELWSADQAGGPFRRVAGGRFYRVAAPGGISVNGPELTLTRSRARFYELRVDTSKSGVGSGAIELVTEHVPDQLIFLRRGAAPFTVAYGRHGVHRKRFEAADLLALASSPDAHAAISSASLEARHPLGGPALLQAPAPAPPYKLYALWAALLCGVLVLAALSYRLVRKV